jgi:hypothetical protein
VRRITHSKKKPINWGRVVLEIHDRDFWGESGRAPRVGMRHPVTTKIITKAGFLSPPLVDYVLQARERASWPK